MRKLTTLFLKALPLLLVMLAFSGLKAQTFQYTVDNQVQVTSKIVEFDLSLLNLDPGTPIEIATIQAGVTINNATYNGGTITAAFVPGGSTMVSAMVPTSIAFTQAQNTVKIAAKSPPACGEGTFMSVNPAAPTKLCRVRLTNSQNWNFTPTVCLNPTFSFTTTPYPTKMSWRDPGCLNVALVLNSSNTFTVGNICAVPACDPPLAFAVTGGGSYCQGGAGVAVGLAGSETGVTYTLYNGAAIVGTFPGTGAALNFGLQMAGTYTVIGERVCPTPPNLTTPMAGNAVVVENPSSIVEFTESACDTYTWALNGQTYTASGDYTYVVGCVTNILHLTITPSSIVTYEADACDSYTWSVSGLTYTSSGTYDFVVGCVTHRLFLTITPSSTVEFTESACDTYTWSLNGQTYTASGDYTYVAGCVTNILHLTITPSSTVEFTESACDTYTWALNGQTYTASGDYTYVVGCVTNILHLTITPSSTVEQTEISCGPYTWAINGQTYTTSGDYTHVIGCVTYVLHLTVTSGTTIEVTETACDSYTWAVNGQTYTASGDYTFVDGCITYILHLTIIPSSTVEFTESACGSFTWSLNGVTYNASGDYTYVVGCVTNILHLTITPYSTVEFTESACDTYTWALNGQTYTVSGDYTFVDGCVTNILHLTITPSSTVEFTEAACDTYTWALNGMTYTASGDYTYVAGCVTNILHLTITPSSTVEFTESAYVSYTWAINGVTYTASGDYTFVDGCVTYILHLTILPCPAASTWNGSVNNDWFNADNWTPAAVPCATTAVTIPMVGTNYPTLTAAAACASVLMQDGASFIGSENLTVGDVTVLRNFPVPGYHYISTPVHPVNFDQVFPLNQNEVWAYAYEEPSGNWINQLYSDNMNVGAGYSVLMNAPQVATFNAPFNNNPVALTLSNMNTSGNVNRAGWNLLGNPFPCSLEWDMIIKGAGVDGAVYLWNGSNYVSFASGVGSVVGGIIPPQNGFFVKTAINNDFLIIPFAARVHSNIPFYKESMTNLLSLKAEGNNYSDEAFIRFSDDASVAFDNQLDAYKLMGIAAAPQLYSMVSNEVLTINTLPMEGNEVVDLGFKAGVNGEYTVNASGIESFDAATPIWLEDLKTGAVQNLRSNPVYNFDYTSGDNENRFRIHFKNAYGTPENSLSGINIYSVNSTVVINNTTNLAGDVAIYDLAGREILRTTMNSDTETRIPVRVAVGSYLVKVVTEKGVSSNKVVIR